jgi:hypothetical protein
VIYQPNVKIQQHPLASVHFVQLQTGALLVLGYIGGSMWILARIMPNGCVFIQMENITINRLDREGKDD